mmetsp:Transcript_9574/g.16795  ORF Transcript_9574/g.16795 Transcript_9574/m.16795 type:complete len:727 (+) Transcript_9574:49-2229(+)
MGDLGEHVRTALSGRVSKGSQSTEYVALMDELKNGNDPERLRDLFAAIGQHASLVSKFHTKFEDLMGLLFLYNWSFGDDVSAAFESILLGLVSSNAGFLEPVFQLITQNFFPLDTEALDDLDSDDSDSDEDNDEDGTQKIGKQDEVAKQRSNRIHLCVKSILRIVPLGCSMLLNVLVAQFPKYNDTVARHVAFVREALKVCEYTPVLRDRILALAFERMLAIDTEIRMEDLTREAAIRGDEETEETDIFDMDVTGLDEEELTQLQETKRNKMDQLKKDIAEKRRIRAKAEKLDQVLEVIFEYSDLELNKNRRSAKVYFQLLLNIFDRMVLPTKTAKFIQFVHFYACRKRADFVDRFVERLLQRCLVSNPNETPPTVQLYASSYLASFLARGLFIGVDSTHSALRHIMKWLHTYNESVATELATRSLSVSVRIEPDDHIQYYAMCQAAIYILMFKGEDLTVEDLRAMRWTEIFNGPLLPLSFISPDLVTEFVTYACEKTILDVDALATIQASLDDSSEEAQSRKIAEKLSGHFPFDPCLLRRTASRIGPFYQEWLSKEGEEHSAEYEICEAAIDTEVVGEDDMDPATLAARMARENEERLQQGEDALPPSIVIPALSSRAAFLLSQLGAGHGLLVNNATVPDAVERDPREEQYWGFAPNSYASSEGSIDEEDRRHAQASLIHPSSISSASMMSTSSPRQVPIAMPRVDIERSDSLSSDDDGNLSGSW